MGSGEGEDTLVPQIREMPAAGRDEEEVFVELAARTAMGMPAR
ncbi:hypothetical protein [Streptomyces sp. NPDC051569]